MAVYGSIVSDPIAAVAAPAAVQTLEMRLISIRYATRDTNLYEFARVDGMPLPDTAPGAHIGLHLPSNLIRQYSLTTTGPAPTSYVVGIKRDPASRGGSKYIHEQLRVGLLFIVDAPRNNFPLVEDAAETVLFAGGIGITPIRSMVERLQKLGSNWHLYYACRSRADAAFHDELAATGKVHFHFDEAAGKVIDLPAIIGGISPSAHLYCCGPTPMLAAFEQAGAGRAPENIHVEYFTAKEVAALGGGYTVELARSKKSFTITEGQRILYVLRDAGIDVAYSCEEGICGACETKVISGTPDHRDAILSESERVAGKTMMICCSGSKSEKLVLDL